MSRWRSTVLTGLMSLALASAGGCIIVTEHDHDHDEDGRHVEVRLSGDSPGAAGVGAVLDDWHDAAADADEERYFGHMTADAVFLGTDATERWTTEEFRAYAHPHFAKGTGWAYTPVSRHVMLSADGRTAWFDEKLQNAKYGDCRGTGVLVRQHGDWKVAHYNLTVPVPNELLDDVVTQIREREGAR